MGTRVHYTGTCPECGRTTKIYSQVEVRLCKSCVYNRPQISAVPKEQLPLPEKTNG